MWAISETSMVVSKLWQPLWGFPVSTTASNSIYHEILHLWLGQFVLTYLYNRSQTVRLEIWVGIGNKEHCKILEQVTSLAKQLIHLLSLLVVWKQRGSAFKHQKKANYLFQPMVTVTEFEFQLSSSVYLNRICISIKNWEHSWGGGQAFGFPRSERKFFDLNWYFGRVLICWQIVSLCLHQLNKVFWNKILTHTEKKRNVLYGTDPIRKCYCTVESSGIKTVLWYKQTKKDPLTTGLSSEEGSAPKFTGKKRQVRTLTSLKICSSHYTL